MGLFRCPKCDAICRTDEEVCHICGYRLKPVEESSKVDEEPKEEIKEKPKVSQKIEFNSGFSRNSLFNSVSFDKPVDKLKEDKPKEDPFADLHKKEEKPKNSIFEDYFNQAFENNGNINEESKITEGPVKEEKIEVKKVEVEVVKTDAVFSMPTEEPIEEIKEEPKKVEEVKVEALEVEEKPKEEIKTSEEPKVTEAPKVEKEPNQTQTNPFVNNGYKPNTSASTEAKTNTTTSSTNSDINVYLNLKKKEPNWVYEWRHKALKNKKTSKTWTIIFALAFIFFLILLGTDKEAIAHTKYWSNSTYYTYEVRGVYVFFSVVTGIGFLISLIVAIAQASATVFVKEVDGYYVLVYGHSTDYKLILENRIVDRFYNKDSNNKPIKLKGKLPNKKLVVATITYQNYDRVIKIEVV